MGWNGVGAFFDGFNQAYDTTGRVLRDYDISKIAKEGVKTIPGATDATRGPDREIDPNAPAQPPQRYEFLGKSYDAMPDEAEQTRGRQLAMAGIYEKYGEVGAGMGMRREVRRDQLADEEAKSAPLRRRQLELDVQGREKTAADDEARRGVDADVGAWMKQRLANPDGTERVAAVDDYLAATQYRAGKLAGAGQVEAAGKALAEHQAQAFVKINLQNAERQEATGRVALAIGAGDFGAVKDFYNRYVPDGAQITDIKRTPAGSLVIERSAIDGTKLAPTTMKDASQLSALLASFKDPTALYQWSQGEFQRSMALRADARAGAASARAGAAEGRAQAEFDAGAGERGLRTELSTAQRTIIDPKSTPQQRTEAQGRLMALQGVMGKGKPAAYKVEAGDVTSLLGDPAVDSKGKPITDVMTGRQAINRNPAKEQAFFRWMAENGITDTNEGLARYPGLRGQGGAPGAAAVAPPTQRTAGQIYDTPRGPMLWNGTGWVDAPSRKASGVVTQ